MERKILKGLNKWEKFKTKRLKTRKYCFPQIWEQYFNVFLKTKREGFNTLLEPTLKIQLLLETFSFYNPDRKSDEFSELYAPIYP